MVDPGLSVVPAPVRATYNDFERSARRAKQALGDGGGGSQFIRSVTFLCVSDTALPSRAL